MSVATPEARTPVMILVDASWEDQKGMPQNARARMENKSPGGACIRLNRNIAVGTRLRVESPWERFFGETRYCRRDGRDYVVGIQKDKTAQPLKSASPAEAPVGLEAIASVFAKEREATPSAETKPEETTELAFRRNERSTSETQAAKSQIGIDLRKARQTEPDKAPEGAEIARREQHQTQEKQIEETPRGREVGRERRVMRRKWFEMGHKDDTQEQLTDMAIGKESPATRAPSATLATNRVPLEAEEERAPGEQMELLSMEDIYRMAGILSPRKGYSISKIAEMLQSEHLRGVSKEMKRASVLMALDAAGVSVEEVLQDAKARQDAIDSYEAEQRRQFEGLLARKAEENTQIQAEMERVKARYTERLRRNLDGMAREKATFGNWLTLKQQETQSMVEAVELCSRAPAPERPSTPLEEEVTLAGARVKPV